MRLTTRTPYYEAAGQTPRFQQRQHSGRQLGFPDDCQDLIMHADRVDTSLIDFGPLDDVGLISVTIKSLATLQSQPHVDSGELKRVYETPVLPI